MIRSPSERMRAAAHANTMRQARQAKAQADALSHDIAAAIDRLRGRERAA